MRRPLPRVIAGRSYRRWPPGAAATYAKPKSSLLGVVRAVRGALTRGGGSCAGIIGPFGA